MKHENYPENLVIAARQKLEEKEYWLKKLSGELIKSNFPYDKKTSVNKNEKSIDTLEFKWQGDIYSKLIKLSKSSDHTLHMILAAALELLLHKYTGNWDIIIGTPIYKQDIPTTLINTVLVLRNSIEENLTFKELLLQVKETIVAATENYSYPIELLIDELSITSCENDDFPLFDAAILVENIHDKIYLQNIKPNMIFSFKSAGECLDGRVEYNSLLYERTTIERIVKNFKHLLYKVLFDINIQVSCFEIISEEEKKQLLFDFNNTAGEFRENSRIHQLFEEQVEKTPDATVVVLRDRQLTYRELNAKANRLARALKKKGIRGDAIVGIMMKRSIEMITAILGVLKAGGAYLPTAPELPIDRIRWMLDYNQVSLLITMKNIFETHYFVSLQQGYKSTEIKPELTAKRQQIKNLNEIQIPQRSLVNYEKYSQFIGLAMCKNSISIQATRGCPYQCSYCDRIWPKTHVVRSAENIFEEVHLYYQMGVRRFVIIDDIFNLNRKNSSRFFELILKNKLDIQLFFPTGVRADLMTDDYIDLMVEAGTTRISLALETASPRLQKFIRKNLDIEKLHKNAEYFCKKYPHVILELFTMHGFPTETEEEALETLNFIKSLKWLHFPHIHILKIYPTTDMAKLAIESGISPGAIERSNNLAFHELPDTLPFDKTFTKKYQSDFFNDYFLSKERLLHVLPYQMKVLTEDEIAKDYNAYLPVDIESFTGLLQFLKISRDELKVDNCLEKDFFAVPGLNKKMKNHFSPEEVSENSLKILLLDLCQFFSSSQDAFNDIAEPPLGLMYLLTHINREFGSKINGRIYKSMIDFDTYEELKLILDEFTPDVIGIRSLTYYRDFFHQTVAMIRQWGFDVPIISGGPYATSSYATILQDKNVDLVVLGEGEITFTEIIQKIMGNNGKLPGDDVLEEIKGIAFIPGKPGLERKLAREIFIMDIPGWEDEDERQNLKHSNQSTDLAYVIYTSGSTGKSKGVGVEHKGVVNMLVARKEEYKMNPVSASLQLFPYAFDGFVTSFFTPVISGAKVILLEDDEVTDISRIKEIIAKEKVTHFISIPGFYKLIIANLTKSESAALQIVTLAGDKISPDLLKITKEKNTNIEIVNEYGVTECSVLSTIYRHQHKNSTIMIGKPTANTRIYIVNGQMRIQPLGVPGEMCIAGVGLARGYLNNPELTAERFTRNPFNSTITKNQSPMTHLYKTGDLARWLPDGNIECLGRTDHQVKVRGYRIELGEIERQLKAHESIKEAVVVVRENKDKYKYLAGYYVEQPKNDNFPQLWPSVAEFFVYDELLYYAMTNDELRNKSYKAAINRFVKDKVVLEIGTGKDVILARFCVEAGAKKVYAVELLEETYKKAKETIIERSLEDKIILIHGDAATIQIPGEADVCVSEIVGSIGGCEGAAVILNKCRRLLKKDGIMIPVKSITKIAAASLPEEIRKNPAFTQTPGEYVKKIFKSVGYSFDLRLCLKNFPISNVISNINDFEYLDFSKMAVEESIDKINLLINKDSRLEGFLVWLNLHTMEDEIIDILKHEHCWLPVFIPVFYPGIDVLKGDRIAARCIRRLSENKINPDYKIKGTLIRKNEKNIEFEYDLPHFERAYRKSPFYQKLFKNGTINIIKDEYRKPGVSELRDFLSKHLPDYMIPSYFVTLDKIPLNPNGKIDRKALPPPEIGMNIEKYTAPTDKVEKRLVNIWAGVLGIEDKKIGTLSNFFELGGNSMNSITLVSEIYKEFGIQIPITQIFVKPVIKEISKYIRTEKYVEEPVVLLNQSTSKKIFCFPPGAGFGMIYKGLADIIKDYSFYAFNFIEDETRLKQYVDIITNLQTDGAYILFGLSAAGPLTFKVAKALEEHGNEVSDIILADSFWLENKIVSKEIDQGQKEFIKNIEKTLDKWRLEFLKDKVKRKAEKYLSFIQSLNSLDVISANVHLILSEKSRGTSIIDCWDRFTNKTSISYQGFGKHSQMFDHGPLEKNAGIIRKILDGIHSEKDQNT